MPASRLRILACPAFDNRSTNPYNHLLYSHMDACVLEYSPLRVFLERFDIFHLHWPEHRLTSGSVIRAFVSCLFLLITIDILHLFRGCAVVWTVHNLCPHETRHPKLERWFYARLLRKIDGYVALSPTGAKKLQEVYGLSKAEIATIPHGHYREVYPTSRIPEARKILGIPEDARVILFLGQIRDYKNVPALISVFREMSGDHICLLIAGKAVGENTNRDLTEAIRGDPRISLHGTHVNDEDVQLFMGACDLVVLPYKKVLNSGSALLALSFDRPVLVPAMGAMKDLQMEIGSQWVRTYDGNLNAGHLQAALNVIASSECCNLSHLDWAILSRQTVIFFEGLLSKRQAA